MATATTHVGEIASRRFASASAIVAAGIALAALLLRITVGPLTIDDAGITFRYARNLALGQGLVFNRGEHVLGTTTPLFAAVLAVLYRIGLHNLPWVALILSALADGATAVLIIWIAHRLGWERRWAVFAGAIFAMMPFSISFAARGMKSSCFTLLVGATCAAALAKCRAPTGLLAASAVLMRPEGLFVAGLALGRHLIQRRNPPTCELVTLLLPVAVWAAIAFWYFGNPVPQSMRAKVFHYAIHPLHSLAEMSTLLGSPGLDTDTTVILSLALGPVLVLAAIAGTPRLFRLVRSRPAALPLAGFAPLLALFYLGAGTRTLLFAWYFVIFVPFLALGAVSVLRWLAKRGRPLSATALSAFLVAWTLLGFNWRQDPSFPLLALRGRSLGRELAYRQVAKSLAPNVTERTVIAAPEIGILGWYSRARILDTAGLVTPEAVHYYPLPSDYRHDITAPPALIQKESPNYLVISGLFLPNQLLDQDWFRRDYDTIATVHEPGEPQHMPVYVFKRVESP